VTRDKALREQREVERAFKQVKRKAALT